MRARTFAPRALGVAAISLLGGLAALGGAALFGELGGGGTTTVVQVSPSPAAATPAVAESRLTISDIYDRASSGVVQITSRSTPGDDDFTRRFAPPSPQQTLGSGFVLDKAGHIVTNYHVIQDADQIEVSFSNQDTLQAKLVGSDPSTDLAILRVEASSRGLTPLQLGDSDLVRVGDPVVAIGNPFGLDRTATAGIVSAVQERTITAPNGYPIDHVIQTDAPINSGNSGGPLLNDRGEVIGVNSQISTGADGTETSTGIGFSVPSNTVRHVAAQLIEGGKVDRVSLGVGGTTLTPELARLFGMPVDTGVLVESVGRNTPGSQAGLVAGTNDVVVAGESYTLGGDVIVAIAGRRVASLPQLRDALSRHKPGDIVGVEIYRGSKQQSVRVVLAALPTSNQSP
ncbi:MAG: trypsin-like peptidase domain-containing protein, partial [Actinobacteria bacterium]|nr:trypsin-like peptidase domain-containing protein [Actinomycetota bacterium]